MVQNIEVPLFLSAQSDIQRYVFSSVAVPISIFLHVGRGRHVLGLDLSRVPSDHPGRSEGTALDWGV